MNLVALGTICEQSRESIKPGQRQELPYIGMESVESETGELLTGALSKTPEDPRANSFRFGHEHVLYGKLRPYLNKVIAPTFEGKCSTELIPLLPKNGLQREYLAYFLRSPATVQKVVARTSGARMPRANMAFVLSMDIPFPSIKQQCAVIDLLSRAEGIVRLRRDARQKTAELIPSLFLETFGAPGSNPKGWPTSKLGDVLAACDYGTSKKSFPQGAGVPVIRMGNVTYAGDLVLSDLKHVELDMKELAKQALMAGDLLFNRTNSKELVGKTGLWDGRYEAVAASYFIRMRVDLDHLTPEYLWAFMNSGFMKSRLFDTARGAIGQANINSKELKEFAIALAPLSLQRDFVEKVEQIQSLAKIQEDAMIKAQATFNVLLHRAFSP